MPEPIILFTDGASSGNPGPGGFGVVLKWGKHRKEISKGFKRTTNNRMELMAVIEGLKALTREDIPVEIYSDSQYVIKAINEGWLLGWQKKGFKKVKNPDLWQELLKLYPRYRIRWHWVKGHAGNPENERCDFLATSAARSPKLIDFGYENQQDS